MVHVHAHKYSDFKTTEHKHKYCIQHDKLYTYFSCTCIGAGAYAGCVYCEHLGTYCHILQKVVYRGNRKYLHRRNKTDFPSQAVEHASTPKTKTMEYIDQANQDFELASTTSERKSLTQISGCKGTYAFRAMNGHDRILDTPVDPMHLIKNIAEHLVKLIVGESWSNKTSQSTFHNNEGRDILCK